MMRFLAAEKSKSEIQDGFYSVFSIVFLNSLIVMILMIAFPNVMANLFFDGATEIVRITGALILMATPNLACMTLFRAFRQMRRYTIFMIAQTWGELGAITYAVVNGFGLFNVLLALIAVRAIILLILFFSIKSQIGIKRPYFLRIREYLHYGLPIIPGVISGWVFNSSDRYVIGYFLRMKAVGFYSAGYSLGNAINVVIGILDFVLPPTLMKLYDEGRMEEVKTHQRYTLKYSLALTIPFVFGAALLSKQVLIMLSTPEIAFQAYLIVPIVALGMLFRGVTAVISQTLHLVKKTKIIGARAVLCALVNLLLNILIVPHIGILGAAITTLFAFSLGLGITIYYSFKEFKFDIEWGFIFKSLVASGVIKPLFSLSYSTMVTVV